MTNASAVIQVDGLRESYGDLVAVDGVSFTVAAGEIFGILGPNGAGKTTTVECLQGLRRPDGGRVSVLGLDPQRDAARLRRRIGSQMQDSALPDRIRVGEAVRLFTPDGASDPERLLDEWELADKQGASFASLSGGQRQRLFVVLALVNDPEVVFLDEMTTGLDPSARRLTWNLVETIRDRGTTVDLVTHFMDEAERLCDRIAIVADGRIAALDTPDGLVAAHGGTTRLRFTAPDLDLDALGRVDRARNVSRHGDIVHVEGDPGVLVMVGQALASLGIVPTDLRVQQPGLEDVYLDLTGDIG